MPLTSTSEEGLDLPAEPLISGSDPLACAQPEPAARDARVRADCSKIWDPEQFRAARSFPGLRGIATLKGSEATGSLESSAPPDR
jgi:hypothetical protein